MFNMIRKTVEFINPVTYEKRRVDVGLRAGMLFGGFTFAAVRIGDIVLSGLNSIDGLPFQSVINTFSLDMSHPWWWLFFAVVMAHLRVLHHIHKTPIALVTSIVLGFCSYGISIIFSAMLIQKFIAEEYRERGWKVSNADGSFGEYSSRFLAIDELGFDKSDII